MADNSTALATIGDIQIPGISQEQLMALPEEERRQLVEFYRQELAESKTGIELKIPRIKISRDSLQFMDELGNPQKELEGVIVFKHVARGLWDRNDKENPAPVCSSLDGIYGTPDERGEAMGIAVGQPCANCPFNQWGSATDEFGNPTRGKACKEMRRVFLAQEGAQLPSVLTLPPTSITAFDKYISARINRGIADIAAKTRFTLREEKDGARKWAVAEPHLGAPVPPQQMLRLAQLRRDIQQAAARMGVDEVDYDTSAESGDDTPF